MRIQETDQILKEAHFNRHNNNVHKHDHGIVSRAWKSITDKITSMFKR